MGTPLAEFNLGRRDETLNIFGEERAHGVHLYITVTAEDILWDYGDIFLMGKTRGAAGSKDVLKLGNLKNSYHHIKASNCAKVAFYNKLKSK